MRPLPDELRDNCECHSVSFSFPSSLSFASQGMVMVENATVLEISNLQHLQTVVQKGMEKRVVAGTNMNAQSSRSHLIMSIIIECTDLQTQAVSKGKVRSKRPAGYEHVIESELSPCKHLVISIVV